MIILSEDQCIAESALKKASIGAVDRVAVGVEGLPEIGAIASLDEQDGARPCECSAIANLIFSVVREEGVFGVRSAGRNAAARGGK